jgi:GH15 family glucan-1,4-alpha-glucosidase
MAHHLKSAWELPDDGIWEMRGGPQHFVHSKMMAWLGFERLARLFEGYFPDNDRYDTDEAKDGLAGREGAFLACSFWLVDAYAYSGRLPEAEALFERLLALRNDLGLLSEEYDVPTRRLVGNFPQAFSHLALIHSATVLSKMEGLRP